MSDLGRRGGTWGKARQQVGKDENWGVMAALARRCYLKYGLFNVLAQPLRHPAHVVRHFVHALGQTVRQGLHCVGHVPHGASERIYKSVNLQV